MNLEALAKQLNGENSHPPVEKWNPPFCGDMDIQIQSDGSWHYMGTPIGRMPLVKLFASVLTTQNGEYFLVTPVEKIRIQVVDAPFVVTQWRIEQTDRGQTLIFVSNVGDEFLLGADYTLALPNDNQSAPLYLNIHRKLQASLHRNVYYQLVEMAQSIERDGKENWIIQSGGQAFTIGVA